MEKNTKRKDNVLASGEATGHAHRAKGRKVSVYGDGDERLLDVPNGAEITHEEHGAQRVAPGEYEISRVREYDPFEKEIRTVRD